MAADRLSLVAARRMALRAQGFGKPRPKRPGLAHVRKTVAALGLVQIDPVSVLAPAHHLVLFSRLGPYDPAHLDTLLFAKRELYEHWAHEASILPLDTWPLLQHRMRGEPGTKLREFMAENREYVHEVLEIVRERGPITAAELAGESTRLGAWWEWSRPKRALEALLSHGFVGISARRTAGFARVYDIAERVIPAHAHAEIDVADAERELVRRAAIRTGVGTSADIADYFRMPVRRTEARIKELVAAGELVPVQVEGWKGIAYRPVDAPSTRPLEAASILSPFDPVVWFRARNDRLFDFFYRIEIYTPAHKRIYGYYTLPFLLGDRIVGRIDLKADHAAGRLRVMAAHKEVHAGDEIAAPLAEELRTVARWLELGDVEVTKTGNLATALRRAIKS